MSEHHGNSLKVLLSNKEIHNHTIISRFRENLRIPTPPILTLRIPFLPVFFSCYHGVA